MAIRQGNPSRSAPNGSASGTAPDYSAVNPAQDIAAGAPGSGFTGGAKPARVLRTGDPNIKDPAEKIPGMPPNMGDGLLPHVVTFQGILSSVSRVYRASDEAIQDSFENARWMLNDPVITECIDQRRRGVALLNWSLEPEDDKDPVQKQLATDLTRIIKKIPNFMKYREALGWAIWHGRYANQHRVRWSEVRGQKRLICDHWLPVHGDKLVFRYDDGTREFDPSQVGIRVGQGYALNSGVQKPWNDDRMNKVQPTDYGLAYFLEGWERNQLAIHRYMIEDGEYEEASNAGRIHGVGIRSRLYWAWYQKQETLAWLMEYLERSATGMEIWFYPFGNEKAKADMMKAAQERIGQNRNIVLVPRPIGEEAAYGVERIEPGMAGAEQLYKVVQEYFGHLIKRYILGQTLTTESAGTGLGSNLADVHLDTYLQIIRYDATGLEECLTSDLVETLKKWNFPKYSKIPIFFRISTQDADVESKMAGWLQAAQLGMGFKEQSVRDLVGAEKPEPGDKVLMLPQFSQTPGGDPGAPPEGANGHAPADQRGRSQADVPRLWAGIQSGQDKRDLGQALGAKGGDGADAGKKDYAADAPPSEDSEREKLATYRAGSDVRKSIDAAAAETHTDPSDDQRKAGNYKKGRFTLHGFPITIETPRGAVRNGTGPDGEPWEVAMPAHYGYLRRQGEASDGDAPDVFIGPDPESEIVFVIDQINPATRRFDEVKILIGYVSESDARADYMKAHGENWNGLGCITPMTLAQFRHWLENGSTKKAVAGQVDKYSKAVEGAQLRELFKRSFERRRVA